MTDNNKPRDKLGLALAGGGFRASLFHIGVLRRMAELDLLRYVETLSTVSGGSIVGALYILLLKRELDQKARLDQADYVRIINDLEVRMCKAIKKNLRVRLFMNPFGILRVLLSEYSLGLRMSRLYERCVFKETVKELEQSIATVGWIGKPWVPYWFRQWWGPGRICLSDIKIQPGQVPIKDGIETYNRQQVSEHGSVVTQLIINATSLNSGARFWFSATEVGDWDHGNIRKDEINDILKRKALLSLLRKSKTIIRDIELQEHKQQLYYILVEWWLNAGHDTPPEYFESLFDDEMSPVIQAMCKADLGKLRIAKISAWYYRKGALFTPPITGGADSRQHLANVITVLSEIGHIRREKIKHWMEIDTTRTHLLLDFIYELFILRLAENTSVNIQHDWDNLTLGQAVGASANFPPVFPPFQMTGIYDDIAVSRLGLTDGGVFDNIGITGLIDEHCNQIIVSDTGSLLDPVQRSSSGRIGMSARILNILSSREDSQTKYSLLERYTVSSGLGRESAFIHELANKISPASDGQDDCRIHIERIAQRLADFHSIRELHGLAMFTIDSNEVLEDEALPISTSDLQKVRTDLDAFGDIEMYALMNQGYRNADYYIKRYMNPVLDTQGRFEDPKDRFRYRQHPYPYHSIADNETDTRSPWYNDLLENKALAQATVKIANYRFFRALRMKLILPWFSTLAIITSLLWVFRDVRFSVHSVLHKLSGFSIQDSASILSFIPENWAELPIGLLPLTGVIISTVLGLWLIQKYWFNLVDFLKQRAYIRSSRMLAKLGRWPQSYKGNLLWLVWLPLPIIAALTITAFAGFSHIFYRLPLLRKTRIGKQDR